jgi:hypothetical protein
MSDNGKAEPIGPSRASPAVALIFVGVAALLLLGGSAAIKWSDKRRNGRPATPARAPDEA